MSTENSPRSRITLPDRAFILSFFVLSGVWLFEVFGLRYSGIPLRDSGRLPFSHLALLLCRVLWMDLGLISALLIMGLVAGALFRRPLLQRLVLAGLAAIVVAISLVRFLDAGFYYYSGMHLGELIFVHAQGEALRLRPDSTFQWLGVRTLIPVLLIVALLPGILRQKKPAPILPRVGFTVFAWAFLSSMMTLASTAVEQRYFATDERRLWLGVLQRSEAALSFPEVGLGRTVLHHYTREPDPVVEKLDPKILAKLQRFGWNIHDGRKYPLQQDNLGEAPFPYPRKPGAPEHPNVIVLLFESLSQNLTSVYDDSSFKDLTPNLQDFAQSSTRINSFYNAGFPTLFGVMGTLCSDIMTPFPAPENLAELNGGPFVRHCLPTLMEEAGYGTSFIYHTDAHYIRMGEVLQRSGFTQVLDQVDIGNRLKEPAKAWGYSDHQTFRYLTERMKDGFWKPPFFITTKTVDTHAPFNFATDQMKYKDGSNSLLDAVYTSDDAFGAFWRYFKSSPYKDNTIVIVTADHSMYPGAEFMSLLPTDVNGLVFDRLPLLIYDPIHELPKDMDIVSSQLDLAPAILHMLDAQQRPHHFEGRSFFGSRKAFPQTLGIGGFGPRYFFSNQMVAGNRVLDTFTDAEIGTSCEHEAPPLDKDALTRCELFKFAQWERTLHVQDRVWPP